MVEINWRLVDNDVTNMTSFVTPFTPYYDDFSSSSRSSVLNGKVKG